LDRVAGYIGQEWRAQARRAGVARPFDLPWNEQLLMPVV